MTKYSLAVYGSVVGASPASLETSRGAPLRTTTRAGPATVPWTVRRDWLLRTLTTSPCAPGSS